MSMGKMGTQGSSKRVHNAGLMYRSRVQVSYLLSHLAVSERSKKGGELARNDGERGGGVDDR